MLTVRHLGPEGARRLPVDELDAVLGSPGWLWLDLEGATTAEMAVLDRLGLPALVVEDLVEDRHLPKAEVVAGTLSLTVHALTVGDERSVTTAELDVALRDHLLITSRSAPIASIGALTAAVDDGREHPARPFVCLHRILDLMNDVYVPFVDHVDRRLEIVEVDVLTEPTSQTRRDVFALQRDVIRVRRAVVPQAEVVRRLGREHFSGFETGDEVLVRDIFEQLDRLARICDSSLALLESALDAYRTAADERTNERLTALTILSAVLLPVSVVAGLFGMNVGIPLADRPGAFGIILGGSVVLVVGMLGWFVRRGWIGRRAERAAAARRRTLDHVLEVPLLGDVLRLPVESARALAGLGRAGVGRATRGPRRTRGPHRR